MAITGTNPDKMELYYVTYDYDDTQLVALHTKKELQSKLQCWNRIAKIEKAIITKGEEVSFEDIKPQKYKGKPYTYAEKYGDKK